MEADRMERSNTPNPPDRSEVFFVDGVRVNPVDRTIVHEGREAPLEPRAFDVLVHLARNHGRVVSRDELLETVWGNRVVTDDAVYRAVRLARSVFGERGSEVLKTVHGRGYRCPSSMVTPAQPGETGWDLRRRLGAVVMILIIMLAVAVSLIWRRPVVDAAGSGRVAVLRFQPATEEPQRAYFGDELAAELAAELSRFEGLKAFDVGVDSALSADLPVETMRRPPGADWIVTGRWRQRGETLSLHLEIHSVEPERLIWSNNMTWPWGELARVPDAVARSVADALDAESSESARAAPESPTADVYDRFLQARHLWRSRAPEDLDRAAGMLKDVLRHDSDFARAYEALASVYLVMPSWQAIEGQPARRRAFAAAREALRLDPHLGEARAILAEEARAAGRWTDADRLFEQALRSEPANPTVLHWYAEFLLLTGRLEAANETAQRAVELDPMSPMPRTVRAWSAAIDSRDAEAREHAQRAVELGLSSSNIILAWSSVRQGARRQAAEFLTRLLRPTAAVDACRLALEGEIAVAQAVDALLEDPRDDQLAVIYHLVCLAMLGQPEFALSLIADETPGIEFAILWAPEFNSVRRREAFAKSTKGLLQWRSDT